MGKLPSGYQELTYIESTGTQWIDTKVFLSVPTDFDIFITVITAIDYRRLYGLAYGAGNNMFQAEASGATSFSVGNNNSAKSLGIPANTPTSISKRGLVYSCNGQRVEFTNGEYTNPNYSVYLLAGRDRITATLFARLHRAKFYQNDKTVFDGVPCRRRSDGAIGMYDLVSQSFFGNSGTGEFIDGEYVIEPTWGIGLSQVSRKMIMRRAEVMTPGVPLYLRGNECFQRSGGWANYNIKPIDTDYNINKGSRVSLAKNAETMDINIVTADVYDLCSNCIAAGGKIDFSKVTRVVADLSVSATSTVSWNNSSLRMIISDSLNNNFVIIKESEPIVTGAANSTKSFDGKFAFDVSDINSEGYLSFLFLRDYRNTFNCSIRSVYLK